MSQVVSMSTIMVVLALVAGAGGDRWSSVTGQGLAFGLVMAVCVGQSVMMLVGGARSAAR